MIVEISKYDITIKPKSILELPPINKGNVLRGSFGSTFKSMVCTENIDTQCKKCNFSIDCPYPIIFEPSPPKDSNNLSKNSDIPRPFVIKPPLTKKTNYNNEDVLRFSLVLINNSIKMLPYFITTFIEMGNRGIGKNKGKFDVLSIKNNNVELFENGILKNTSDNIKISNTDKQISKITIEFLTETTIKDQGQILSKPTFTSLIKRLRDRVSSLSTFYGDPWEIDFKKLAIESEQVIKVEDNTYWNEKSRFSKRNNIHHDMSGFMGEVSFEGNITQFMEILQIGELIHVGKGAVFGNGWYKILEAK